MHLRHELSAYSPIGIGDVAAAAVALVANDGAADRLCRLIRERYAAREAVLVDSGTHALQLALRLHLRAKPKDALIALPAFSCFDVATAAIAAGAPVVLYDVDPLTLAPDQGSLETAMRRGASVAIIAPLYGIPIDWREVASLAERYGVSLIEDAAQGHGASWHDRPLGGIGDVSIVSFGRGKGWTGGHGGALLLRGGTPALADTVSASGWTTEVKNAVTLELQWLLGRPQVYGLPRAVPWLKLGETRYRAPSDVKALPRTAARVILRSTTAADAEAAQRRERAAVIIAAVSAAPWVTHIRVPRGSTPGYLRLPVLLPRGMRHFADADRVARLGIAQSYPITLAELDPLRPYLADSTARYPGASRLASDLVTMPTHSRVSTSALSAILRVFAANRV